MGAGDGFGNPEACRSAALGGMRDVTALALDRRVDELLHGLIHHHSFRVAMK